MFLVMLELFLSLLGLSGASNALSGLGNLFFQQSAQNLQREQFQQSMDFNREQADINRTFAHDEAELNRQFNSTEAEKAFNREAEYNSYSAQMQRMQDAGINPNTIAQQLSSSANATAASGSAASASPASAPSVPNYTIPNMDFVRNAVNDTFNNYLMRKQADKAASESHSIDEMLPVNKANVEAVTKKVISESNLSDEQADQIRQLTPLLVNKTEEEINQILATTSAALAESGLKREQMKGQQLENLSKEIVKGIAEKYGIVIDGNSMTTLITTLLTPNGSQIISDIISNLFKGVGKSIFDGLRSFF